MKTLASALVLSLALTASASAQTFLQNYQAKASKVSGTIKDSSLNSELKSSYQGKLQKINETVCGHGSSLDAFIKNANAANCPGISASKVEEANDALDSLSDDLANAIKNDGSKSQADLYAPKLAILKQKVQAAKMDSKDQAALLTRISNFGKNTPTADHFGANVPSRDKNAADKLEQEYQKLSDDVDAALELAKDKADSAGFAKAFTTKADALKNKIAASKLTAAIQQDFQKQLTEIRHAACSPADARQAAAAGKQAADAAACFGTPTTLDKGGDAVDALSAAVDAAIAADGTKNLAQIYKPKLAALQAKLAAAPNINKADLNALNLRITDLQRNLDSMKDGVVAGKPVAQGKSSADVVQTTADTFQKLSDDVDAAVALAQENKGGATFYADLQKQLNALDAKVKATKLDPAFKGDFTARAQKIVADVCAIAAGKANYDLKGCPAPSPVKIEAAQNALDKLSADVDAAVAAYGTESLAQVYKPKLDALLQQLTKSTVSSANQKPLLARISSFNGDLKNAAQSRKQGDPVQLASDLYDKLAADVAAAIKLSPITKADAQALLIKVNALKAKVDAARLLAKDLADLDKRLTALQGQLAGAPTISTDDANNAYNELVNDLQTAQAAAAAATQKN